MNMPEAISHLEEHLTRILAEDPDFDIGPTMVHAADESQLDDLVSFIGSQDGCDASKETVFLFDATGGSFVCAVLKAKKSVAAVAVALARYCGLRRCKISIKIKGTEIVSEAADAAELERLLRVTDSLFIHPPEKKTDGAQPADPEQRR